MSQTVQNDRVAVAQAKTARSGKQLLWLGFLLVMALLVGGAGGAAMARYWLNDNASQKFEQIAVRYQRDLGKTHLQLVETQARLDALQARWQVEESTRKGLEESLHTAQQELGKARDQLAFFDQLMPPGPKGTVSVRAFDVEPVGPHLSYRVLLMRDAANDTRFKGRLEFIATGTVNGKKTKMPLKAATPANEAQSAGAVSDTNGFALSFEQFQRSGGLLSVPGDFTPLTVTLNVLEGDKLRISRTVNLAAPE